MMKLWFENNLIKYAFFCFFFFSESNFSRRLVKAFMLILEKWYKSAFFKQRQQFWGERWRGTFACWKQKYIVKSSGGTVRSVWELKASNCCKQVWQVGYQFALMGTGVHCIIFLFLFFSFSISFMSHLVQ